MQIGDRVLVDPGGESGAASNSGTGDSRIGVEARVGSVWSQGSLTLADRAAVAGDVRHAGVLQRGNDVTITGTVQNQPMGATVTLQLPSVDMPSSAADVRLEPEQVATLAPGIYGVVSVKSRARLKLESGAYVFRELSIEPQAVIELDSLCAPVDIALTTSLFFRGEIAEHTGQIGAGLNVSYYGSATAHIEAPFVGTIVAPQAELILNSAVHRGRFVARRLRVQADAQIKPLTGQQLPVACGSPESSPTPCTDGLCCPEGETGAKLTTVCRLGGAAACVYGSAAPDRVAAKDWQRVADGSFMAFTGGGADVIDTRGIPAAVATGAGDDVICGGATKMHSYFIAGAGNDTIRALAGTSVVHPGAGADKVYLGGGGGHILIADLCEVSPGDEIFSTGGTKTIDSPYTLEELVAAGLALHGNFEVNQISAVACYAACGGHLGCNVTDICGSRANGQEVCIPSDYSTEILAPSQAHLYPGVAPGIRQKIFNYLDASNDSAAESALLSLRQSRYEVRAAALAELERLSSDEFLEWRRTQVHIIGKLGGLENVPLLRSWAIAPLQQFPDDTEHDEGPAEQAYLIQVEAAAALGAIARAGVGSATDALEAIIQTPNSGGVDQAVIEYRLLGETPARMTRLRGLLPPSRAYLADVQLIRLETSAGPQPSIQVVPR